jgi:hypothetical protein
MVRLLAWNQSVLHRSFRRGAGVDERETTHRWSLTTSTTPMLSREMPPEKEIDLGLVGDMPGHRVSALLNRLWVSKASVSAGPIVLGGHFHNACGAANSHPWKTTR